MLGQSSCLTRAPSAQAQPHPFIPSTERCRGWGMGGCGWENDIPSLVLLHKPQLPSGEPAPAWAFPGLHFLQDTSPALAWGSRVWICSDLAPPHGQHTNLCSTRASSKPSPGCRRCCDTWWTSFPSPQSPQGCLLLFFPPRSCLLCSGKANLSSQRDGKKTHIQFLHKSQAISLPEIIT